MKSESEHRVIDLLEIIYIPFGIIGSILFLLGFGFLTNWSFNIFVS